jgi:hypothetical protein
VAVGLFALLLASAEATNWSAYHDHAHGFSIQVPAAWLVIPQGRSAQQALISRLRASGQSARAAVVQSYASDRSQSGSSRVFDALQFPQPPSRIETDVVVFFMPLPTVDRTPGSLKKIAGYFFSDLKKSGAEMRGTDSQAVTLEGGQSFLMYGSAAASGFNGERTGFALYLMMNTNGLLQIEFRTDSRFFGSDARLFRQIAETVRLHV